jgi:hypothetical protein
LEPRIFGTPEGPQGSQRGKVGETSGGKFCGNSGGKFRNSGGKFLAGAAEETWGSVLCCSRQRVVFIRKKQRPLKRVVLRKVRECGGKCGEHG